MSAKTLSRRIAVGAATVGLVSTAAVVVASGPASASISTGRIQLCAQGNYASDITWNPGGLHTYVVAQGGCQTFNMPQGVQTFTIGGFYNTIPAHFSIVTMLPSGGDPFGPGHAGMAFGTRGTTTSPSYTRWQ
jgi:hypothetical protein